MPKQSKLVGVFRALGHPVRFAVMQALANGECPVSELAAPFEMALPSFMQHLRVLEDGGLVQTRKAGRERLCRLRPEPLRRAEGWLTTQRALWESRLDQLDAYVLQLAASEGAQSERKATTKHARTKPQNRHRSRKTR